MACERWCGDDGQRFLLEAIACRMEARESRNIDELWTRIPRPLPVCPPAHVPRRGSCAEVARKQKQFSLLRPVFPSPTPPPPPRPILTHHQPTRFHPHPTNFVPLELVEGRASQRIGSETSGGQSSAPGVCSTTSHRATLLASPPPPHGTQPWWPSITDTSLITRPTIGALGECSRPFLLGIDQPAFGRNLFSKVRVSHGQRRVVIAALLG